jgi:hypothetical protein
VAQPLTQQQSYLVDASRDLAQMLIFLENQSECITMENLRDHLRLLVTTAWLILVTFAKADELTSEEQALVNKGAVMEMYKPDEHSRHFIVHIDSATDPQTGKTRKIPKDSQKLVCFVFGIEDAEPAREQGRSMAEFHYSPSQAHEFLFAQGWDKYHDRFFTRCYVQEGEHAYDLKAAELRQKAEDQRRRTSS